MENNYFEKQVQQKMEDLKIQPSEKTWAGIESRIGKKSSRRKMLWFLLPALFLLAGGGYLFMLDGNIKDQKLSQLPKQTTEIINPKKAVEHRSSDDSTIAATPAELSESKQVSLSSINESSDSRSITSKSISHSQPSPEKDKINPQNLDGNKKKYFIIENKDESKKEQKPTEQISGLNGLNQTSKIAIVPDMISVSGDSVDVAKKEADSLSNKKVLVPESSSSNQEIYSEEKKEIVIKEDGSLHTIPTAGNNKTQSSSTNTNWKIGLSFSAARAYLGDGIQFGSNLDKSFSSFDPNYSYNSPSSRPGTSFGQASIGPASSPENSIGFTAGIILKNEISPKTSFATGLSYTYYTSTILIGNQLSAGNYSSTGILSSYRNNFHFIDLPLTIHFNFNKSQKVPLNLSAGFAVSQLLASDAVQYKSGFYDVDNSFLNKTQFGFNTGISATFFKRVSAGPFYHYGINSLAKEGLYGKKHLNFLGIKAAFIFQKK